MICTVATNKLLASQIKAKESDVKIAQPKVQLFLSF